MDSVFRANDLPVTRLTEYTTVILPLLGSLQNRAFFQKDKSVFSTCASYLSAIKKEMEPEFKKDDFWMVLIENLIAENDEYNNLHNPKLDARSKNIRDLRMAQNLDWLCKTKYPGKKIIVWAHNLHISKFGGRYENRSLDEERSLGTVFAEDLKMETQTYILGFTSYRGTAGRLGGKKFSIEQPNPDAFENWLPRAWEYGFTDFSNHDTVKNLPGERFYMSGSPDKHIHESVKAQWQRIFDGVFYIREMYTCGSTLKYSDILK